MGSLLTRSRTTLYSTLWNGILRDASNPHPLEKAVLDAVGGSTSSQQLANYEMQTKALQSQSHDIGVARRGLQSLADQLDAAVQQHDEAKRQQDQTKALSAELLAAQLREQCITTTQEQPRALNTLLKSRCPVRSGEGMGGRQEGAASVFWAVLNHFCIFFFAVQGPSDWLVLEGGGGVRPPEQ